MELKKNPKADLRRYSGLFLEIGFVVSLGIMLLAFNVTQHEKSSSNLGELDNVLAEEEIIPVTRQQEIKPPPPPEPPKVTEVLNIVEDDVEIEDELEIEDVEDVETAVEIVEIEEEEEEEEAQVFFIVENMPEFPGGDLELRKHISQNVSYPEIAKENGIQGRVFVQFVVNQKGKVEQVKVVRGVDPALDKEAIRVITNLPSWKPGSQRGKPVRVSFTVPINFQLN